MGRIAASAVGIPRPVVKWAGGKAKLAPQIARWMPKRIGTYVEPFCGGAAVFFTLAAESPRRFRRAILTDKNAHLIALYRAIQARIEDLIERVRDLAERYRDLDDDAREEQFYAIRNEEPPPSDLVARGARVLFLNKTCFNGLWRENASGRNNVPFGRYVNPRIFDEDALHAAHRAFEGVELRVADFSEPTTDLGAGDFVYFDPPYVPVSKTANFTAYAKEGFGAKDQERLKRLLSELYDRGVGAMLSNARTPETEALYREFKRRAVPMPRSINSAPDKRGLVEELVVSNEPAPGRRARPKVAS